MQTFFPMRQVKIIVGICVILAVGFIIIFPKLHRPAYILERNTYCDGYAAQAKKTDPAVDLRTSYKNCIKNYAQS
jgi:hypothetical protein